jgi:hypothetical protein
MVGASRHEKGSNGPFGLSAKRPPRTDHSTRAGRRQGCGLLVKEDVEEVGQAREGLGWVGRAARSRSVNPGIQSRMWSLKKLAWKSSASRRQQSPTLSALIETLRF